MHQNITELTTKTIVSNDNGKIELVTSSSKIVDDSTQETQYKYKHELHKYKIGESGEFTLDTGFEINKNQRAKLNKLSDKEKNHLLDISEEEIKKLLNGKGNTYFAQRNEKLQQKEATEVPDFKEIHRNGYNSLLRLELQNRKYRIQIRHGQTLKIDSIINKNQNAQLNKLSDEEKNHLLGMSAKAIKKLLNDKVNAYLAQINAKRHQKIETEGLNFETVYQNKGKSLRRAKVVSQKGRKYEIQIWHGQTLNAEFETDGNQNTALNKLSDKEKNSLLDMNAEDFKNYLNKRHRESRESRKRKNPDNKSDAQQDNPLYFLAEVALGEQEKQSSTYESQKNNGDTTAKKKYIDDLCEELANENLYKQLKLKIKTAKQDNGDTTTNLSKELGNNPQTKLANPNIKSANSSECPSR